MRPTGWLRANCRRLTWAFGSTKSPCQHSAAGRLTAYHERCSRHWSRALNRDRIAGKNAPETPMHVLKKETAPRYLVLPQSELEFAKGQDHRSMLRVRSRSL